MKYTSLVSREDLAKALLALLNPDTVSTTRTVITKILDGLLVNKDDPPTYSGLLEELAGKIVKEKTPDGLGLSTSTADEAIKDVIGVLRSYFKAAGDSPDPTGGGDSAVPGDIRQSVAIANVKTVAEQPAMLSNLSFSNLLTNNNLSQQNAVSFQQSMNQLGITVTAKGVNRISDLGPLEAASVTEVLTANDVAKDIAELRAVKAKGGK